MITLPPSFKTQTFGELILREGENQYSPLADSEDEFRFAPGGNVNPPAWIELIDSRVPHLKNHWPDLIEKDEGVTKAALHEQGLPGSGDASQLKQIRLTGDNVATLRIQAESPDTSPLIEIVVNSEDELESAIALKSLSL